VDVAIEGVRGVDALLQLLVRIGKLLGLLDPLLDLLLRETALAVGDRDLLGLAVAMSSTPTSRMPLESISTVTST
jgi:hypothetical protein